MDTEHGLVGQVALVTGAGRGIGAAIARKLANLGATVVLCGRTQSALDSTARAILGAGGKTEVIPCDVTLLHQLEYAAARVDSTFGRLDILVNNAGVGGFTNLLHELPPEDWERILNTNLRGVYFSVRAFAPLMIRARSGHIVISDNVGGVKHFSCTLRRALLEERHFALVDGFAGSNHGPLVIHSGQDS
ncbi:MAG TPA: SDR family NAD(P)-dependent oxidoreductase, partial [Candidatus Sulfotelmatobacter sp.]|nr:SDR family NAD(P)-dependent oxidoreductase [Candidatus Sulfotelmatobacter sp.]